MNVSINISARDLMDAELPIALRVDARAIRLPRAVDRPGDHRERAILDDPGHAIENLQLLHSLGCRLAIDDYGTGYSSLAYLRRLR